MDNQPHNMWRSKFARKILIIFVCCCIIPITLLAVISYLQVSTQLTKDCYLRLSQSAKTIGMSIYERLLLLENELILLHQDFSNQRPSKFNVLDMDPESPIIKRFDWITIRHEDRFFPVLNTGQITQNLENKIKDLANKQISYIYSSASDDKHADVFLLSSFLTSAGSSDIVIAKVNIEYLWGIGRYNTLPPLTELCVLSPDKSILISSASLSIADGHQDLATKIETSRKFAINIGGRDYFACAWEIFLKPKFQIKGWHLVLLQPKKEIMAPIKNFKINFILIALLSLWIVLLLIMIYIRRSITPLQKLKEGTRQIAKQNFKFALNVKSNDEFEELAHSFNTMSIQLGNQFEALNTLAEISKIILSSLDKDKIIKNVIDNLLDFFHCKEVCIGLIENHKNSELKMYFKPDTSSDFCDTSVFQMDLKDREMLISHPDFLSRMSKDQIPNYLSHLISDQVETFFILPLFIKKRLSGLIVLTFPDTAQIKNFDIVQARQLADQIAVALSNANLVEELDDLNWGTLEALARAVDAKSPWTSGHSVRVAQLSIQIGAQMKMEREAIDDLHRAALLHDIGKIGISLDILDSTERLSDEEFNLIKTHPVMGARILEPIHQYRQIVPIVRQHHENFDGKGYPDGLSGQQIVTSARILSVADVYDALVSDRPYRKGMKKKQVIDFIINEKGKKFDPNVVDAFVKVV